LAEAQFRRCGDFQRCDKEAHFEELVVPDGKHAELLRTLGVVGIVEDA